MPRSYSVIRGGRRFHAGLFSLIVGCLGRSVISMGTYWLLGPLGSFGGAPEGSFGDVQFNRGVPTSIH